MANWTVSGSGATVSPENITMDAHNTSQTSRGVWVSMAPCKNCHLNYGEHVGYKCLFQETTYEPSYAY